MSPLKNFVQRHALWVGFLCAFVPLLVLLVMQYRWLVRLERTTTLAHKASLAAFLDRVVADVEQRYGAAAEHDLAIPASSVRLDRLERVASHFAALPGVGVKHYFVLVLDDDGDGQLRFYDPATEALVDPGDVAPARAVRAAARVWSIFRERAVPVDNYEISVEERDPDNRLIQVPVVDLMGRVVGVAGMVLDTDAFVEKVLPPLIDESLRRIFQEGDAEEQPELVVSVRDEGGKELLRSGERRDADALHEVAADHFRFAFKDLTLAVQSPDQTAEQWARTNLGVNVALSGLLSVLLVTGVVISLHLASRAVKLSEMKSDFVSNVSHELRTPLASIRVFGELLASGRVKSDEKVREYGAYIDGESRRLSALINNILDFARIESGRKSYSFRPVDPAELVAGVTHTFRMGTRSSGLEVELQLPEGPLPPISADPEAIGQALHNLLDNAVKYSGERKRVAIGVRGQGGEVVMEVADEGVGIARAEQRKIFDRFHRVSTGLVHDVRGSGLGLAIVRHIMEAHGGKAEVESEVGRGSRFRLRFPASTGEALVKQDDGAAPVRDDGQALPARPGGAMMARERA